MPEHTPPPWLAHDELPRGYPPKGTYMRTGGGFVTLTEEDYIYARRCVNAHDALVEACWNLTATTETLVAMLHDRKESVRPTLTGAELGALVVAMATIRQAHAALALAKKENPDGRGV